MNTTIRWLASLFFVIPMISMYAQVTLQPWVEVFGTVPGRFLGLETKGITPSQNFPFQGSISEVAGTGVYLFQNQNDTVRQQLFFGYNMQTGDLNGDGREDLVLLKSGGTSNMDTVVIYWGTTTGIDTLSPTKLHGLLPQDGFGTSLCIGNLIGDSIPDLVVGSPQYPPSPVIQGRVYIYSGGSTFDTIPAVILNGDSARYTLSVASVIGDLNNDGYNDLAVRGWFQLGSSSERFDYVNIWLGGGIFDTTRDMQLRSAFIASTGLGCFDANGDGIDDLLWTNRDSSRWVYVHYGGSAFDTIPNLRLRDPLFAEFGTSIGNAGDMNGDGYDDVLVGAYFSNNPGFVFVYGGGPNIDQHFDAAVGMSAQSHFGYSTSSLGDVTGDGLADIIVGAPNYEFGNQKGYWGIFKGDSTIRVTEVKEEPALSGVVRLYQCYPNPFNPITTIKYELSKSAYVQLEVFDLLGRRVATLLEGNQLPGADETVFDGTSLASGVYLYRLTAKTPDGNIYTDTKKVSLIK